MFPEADTGTPFCDRPDRARHKPTPAVGADVEEHGFYTVGAECALIGANPRVRCVRRQILIAAFAVRSQFQHNLLLSRRVCRTLAAHKKDSANRFPFFAERPVADRDEDQVDEPRREQFRVPDLMAASAAVQHTKFWSDHRSADPGKTAKHVGVFERDKIRTEPAYSGKSLPPDHLKFAHGGPSFQ